MSNRKAKPVYHWEEKDVTTEFTRLGIHLKEGKGTFRFAVLDIDKIFLTTFWCQWSFISDFLTDYGAKDIKLIINGTWALSNNQPAGDIVGYDKNDTTFLSNKAKLWPRITDTNPHITDRWAFAIKKTTGEPEIIQGSPHNSSTLESSYKLFLHGIPIIAHEHLDPDDASFIGNFNALNDEYNGGEAYAKLTGSKRIARGAVGILKDKRIVILSTGDGASRFDPDAIRPGMTILGLAKLLSKFKFDGNHIERAVMLDGSKPHGIHACQRIDSDIRTQPQQAMQHPRFGKTVTYLAAFRIVNTTINKVGSVDVPRKHKVEDGSIGVIDTPLPNTDALLVKFKIEKSDHFKPTEKVELYVMSRSAYNAGPASWPSPEKTWTGTNIHYNSEMVYGLTNFTILQNLSDADTNGLVCMVRSLDASGKEIANHSIAFQIKPRFAETLAGLVCDAGSGNILDNVDVTAKGEGSFTAKVKTNRDGKFQISDVPFGKAELSFELEGWEKAEKKLKIDKRFIEIKINLQFIS